MLAAADGRDGATGCTPSRVGPPSLGLEPWPGARRVHWSITAQVAMMLGGRILYV